MPAPLQKPQSPALTAPEQARLALQGFFRIVELWGADNAQARAMLGHPPERTFFKWKRGEVGAVPLDVIRRVGYVAGIWKALQIVYSNPAQADAWVRQPNRAFGGQPPLARMSAGDVTDLAAVRDYLDTARAPWS
jgi:Antitoxin Xre/MbcA/ParS C-terminal toxin-binding domain